MMVNLVMMFVASMAIGYGDLSNRDMGPNDAGFSKDQRGKLAFVRSTSWPDQVGLADAHVVLTDFLTAKGNTVSQIDAGRIKSNGRIPMEKHAGIGNHVAGDIHYTLVIEDKGPEFTYWFTDLTYQPYRNDRYGKRVKATASPIPLERQPSKINERVWYKQKTYAYEAIDGLASQLLGVLEVAGQPTVVNISM